MFKIGLAEDDVKIASLIKTGLGEHQYEVTAVPDGKLALEEFQKNPYDLVILDIMMPGLNGIEVCRELRNKNKDLPILILTALGSVEDKVIGLGSGADDYLLKPFHFKELLARLEALLRRSHKNFAPKNLLRFADITIDTYSKTVQRAGIPVELTAKEYTLLELFLKNPNRLLSRQYIAENAWDISFDTGTNVIDEWAIFLKSYKKMKIKDRLALYFTLISTLVLLGVLFTVYFTFHKFMQAEFFARLTDRTMVTAKLYLQADEISSDSLSRVRAQYLEKLNGEVIRIYNDKNDATFIGDDQQYWNIETIEKVRRLKKINFRDGQRQVVGIYYKDNQGNFVILASAIDQSTQKRIDKLWKIMLVIFLIIFIGLLLSARWIAKKILQPLEVFISQVKLIKSNNLYFRVQEGNNKDEIQLLAQNFNNLMEHIEQSFILQKTFVANASHELRTPITRMIIGAEIALSQERSKQDYQKALQAVLEDSEKLEKIISSLLNLAQTDLEYGATNLVVLRIDELLWKLQQEWNQNGAYQLLIEVRDLPMEEEHLSIACNPTLLQIALDNIISNAFKFSDQQAVKCILDINDKGIHIYIEDKGTGMDESQIGHIFKPFYSSSGKAEHSGNGMGLYMAHKIISMYHASITVTSKKGIGTSFLVFFPKF
eukprot:gene14012-16516_t